MKVLNIVGARPNFMKMAPIVAEMQRRGVAQVLVHTGQHYDEAMSASFFRDLGMPEPDINLEVGSGSHAQQTARIMMAFEAVVLEHKPDWVVVVGDVNSRWRLGLGPGWFGSGFGAIHVHRHGRRLGAVGRRVDRL